uniref:Uncharacterized protein n=1 Tax=Anguilla anguilla TaxID=7936 RepID=A0A0E9RJV7_ANGAN
MRGRSASNTARNSCTNFHDITNQKLTFCTHLWRLCEWKL